MNRYLYVAACLAVLTACTKEEEFGSVSETGSGSSSVEAVAKDFVMDESSKTTITQSGDNAPAFAWREGDVIGVIPLNDETVQSNYKISEIGANPKQAVFDGGVWALKEGRKYAAYYPFRKEASISSESIAFSFRGQRQSANNSLGHLGAYDLMYASAVVPQEGFAQFGFEHRISLVRFQITVPKTDTYTVLELESDVYWFAATAALNLSDGTVDAVGAYKSASVELENISVAEGDILTVWLAMLPTASLEGHSLRLNLVGRQSNYVGQIDGIPALKAGKAYSYACTFSPDAWILFDTGTLTEVAWGEKEVNKEMWFQQINDTLRLCRIEGCWGHDIIASGGSYDVQPYTWIWNTKTNQCVVRPQYMGYDAGADGLAYTSDAAGFYDLYQGWGQSALSHADYYNWASRWLVKNVDVVGGSIPYYDGNGGFYLADWLFLVANGNATGTGFQFGGGQDTFIGDSFTRITDYNNLEYEPLADGVDSSALWQTKFDIKVQVAEDPNGVPNVPSQVCYIPDYVDATSGLAFIVAATDADPSRATYYIRDADNVQYSDYEIFGKKLGLSIVAGKSYISGPIDVYPCYIELCIDANLYDLEYDEKGRPVYVKTAALGEFTDYITLTNATKVWYSADQLYGLQKNNYVSNYNLFAKDFFNGGTDYSWPVSVEDAGEIEGVSYLKFKHLLPFSTNNLPVNEFLVEWYNGYLYFATGEMLGKFNQQSQELGVTLYPLSSKAVDYYPNSYLLGGYFFNDEQTYECVPFVNYPYNSDPVDGFCVEVENHGFLCAFYEIFMEFAGSSADSTARAASASFIPAKYEVRTLPEVKALKAGSVTRANLHVPMAVSPAKERAVRTSRRRSHPGTIDTSRTTEIEKNLTPVQFQPKNNVRL